MANVNFQNVRFIKSAISKDGFLFDHPAVTFIGRSNVGKSTLINSLVKRNSFMKTSKTAGRTNMINYSLVDEQLYLCDCPGYGFATFKRDYFAPLMRDFLEDNKALKKVYLLVDSRRLLLPADIDFCSYLDSINIPYAFIFTKCDKLNTSDKHYLNEQLEKIKDKDYFLVGLKDEKQYLKVKNDIVSSCKIK